MLFPLSSCLITFLILSLQESLGESVGHRIINKITTGLRQSVMKVRTCGLPRITSVMRNLTLDPGDQASFECMVDMKCMVSYIQWYHTTQQSGSQRLLRTGSSAGNPYSFSIPVVRRGDGGFYSCVAGNILGETVSSAYLEINQAFQPSPHLPLLLLLLLPLLHSL